MTSFQPSDVLALIPARGGSKGVLRKNIRPLLGKPLLAWTIESALAAPGVGRVIVSTDDPDIATIAREFGADVPFMRPAEYAQDHTPDFPVLKHVLDTLTAQESKSYAAIVWLRPTTPLRDVSDITNALEILSRTDADAVRSVSMSKAHPYWMKTIEDGFLHPFIQGRDERTYLRRQSLPPIYSLNGAVDIANAKTIPDWKGMWGERIAAYVMPPERSLNIDIDTDVDFTMAETFLSYRKSKP